MSNISWPGVAGGDVDTDGRYGGCISQMDDMLDAYRRRLTG